MCVCVFVCFIIVEWSLQCPVSYQLCVCVCVCVRVSQVDFLNGLMPRQGLYRYFFDTRTHTQRERDRQTHTGNGRSLQPLNPKPRGADIHGGVDGAFPCRCAQRRAHLHCREQDDQESARERGLHLLLLPCIFAIYARRRSFYQRSDSRASSAQAAQRQRTDSAAAQ